MSDRQLFDSLPAHIEAALRDSIEEFGVLVPVFIDQDGQVIDGHHRSRIATDLGVEFDTVTIEVDDEEHALRVAHTLNADRRQLSTADRLRAAARLRERGHSYRAIGEALGVSHTQAQRDVESTGTDVPVQQPDRVLGIDGKSRPARRPEPEPSAELDATVARHPAASRPTPPEPSPEVDAWVESDQDVQDARYLHEFAKALARSDDFLRFDAERVAAICTAADVTSLEHLLASTTTFLDKVKRARSGLRVVNGGKG